MNSKGPYLRHLILAVCLVVLGCIGLSACNTSTPAPSSSGQAQEGKTKLVIFEADSLMVPFAEIQKEFEQANPDINVEIQAHGSIQVIRQVTELGQSVDVVAVADYSLVPMLMYQTLMRDGKPYADWYIESATNELVLAYTPKSKYAGELDANNWYQIISRPDVRVGLADPRMDSVGYRTLMTTKLAESYYGVNNIMQDSIGKYFTMPITADDENGNSTISVPELLEPSDSHMVLRGAHMQLLSLLESGDVDYTFDYKSVVIQDNLNYLELPPEINLGDSNFANNYQKVVVKIDYQRFKSVIPVFEGLPIGYGITIANNSQHKTAAIKFLQFVLGQEGQRIFLQEHHPPLIPPYCDNISALPDELKPLFK
jgi:molybdate/tungstate transport system substrate-binding protein